MKKRILTIILSCLILTFFYFVFDINNLSAGLGINSSAINWDVASIIVGNLVVISLYLITFSLLDNRSIEKDKNQREVALLLLSKTFEKCRDFALLFDSPENLKKAVEKCDFSKVYYEDKQFMYYLQFPFEFHDRIIEFACSGTISKKEFSDYMKVEAAFKKHISAKIIFYDREEFSNHTRKEFFEVLEMVENSLNRSV